MHSRAFSDDRAVADGATSPAQSVSEDGEEDDWCNDRLEGEEVLNLGSISKSARMLIGYLGSTLVYGMHRKGSCRRKYSRNAIIPEVEIP